MKLTIKLYQQYHSFIILLRKSLFKIYNSVLTRYFTERKLIEFMRYEGRKRESNFWKTLPQGPFPSVIFPSVAGENFATINSSQLIDF